MRLATFAMQLVVVQRRRSTSGQDEKSVNADGINISCLQLVEKGWEVVNLWKFVNQQNMVQREA